MRRILPPAICTNLDRLAWLKIVTPTPADQGKYSGTIEWLRQIQGSWQSRANVYKAWQVQQKPSATHFADCLNCR